MVNVILVWFFRHRMLYAVGSGVLPILGLYVQGLPCGPAQKCTQAFRLPVRRTDLIYIYLKGTGLSNDPNYYRLGTWYQGTGGTRYLESRTKEMRFFTSARKDLFWRLQEILENSSHFLKFPDISSNFLKVIVIS